MQAILTLNGERYGDVLVSNDYLGDVPVPLVKFTATNNTAKNNNDTRITSQLNGNYIRLYARTGTDDGYKDVTEERNARLVWDSTAQTLYYQQDKVERTILSVADNTHYYRRKP